MQLARPAPTQAFVTHSATHATGTCGSSVCNTRFTAQGSEPASHECLGAVNRAPPAVMTACLYDQHVFAHVGRLACRLRPQYGCCSWSMSRCLQSKRPCAAHELALPASAMQPPGPAESKQAARRGCHIIHLTCSMCMGSGRDFGSLVAGLICGAVLACLRACHPASPSYPSLSSGFGARTG